MKKSTFRNQSFYWIIISILCGLLIWNLYVTITQSKLIGLLPIAIQCTLLTMIFKKHEYAKIGIKIWATLFLAIASGLQFVGRLLQDLADGFSYVPLQHYLITGITILIGVLIVVYTNKTVEIETLENSST
ncbi:hypothetical protein GS399_20475 [Pedobacter sp. HMF7647]|uniref:DUF4293 family protein n=1 Tax=Hufsiella arboris TaxID=2695275 RepID=A0A7K1YFK1_9SPHI|nr:hypothetical protein [Hufsiella arboris]MXV53342.1 hypothetical protein [Hufsiella arboris]